ncbi:MAG: helix-turn-helix domain-containing protein [Clostridiales bacterium]|nr:helix-turn-helix domain-containing protein [Clostridiales bacterium]
MTGIRNEATDQLFRTLLELDSLEECYDLFEDLCTIKELQDISQRLQVALLLDKGMKYQDIGAKTGVSPATISRVNRCLLYGSGGYRLAIDKIRKEEAAK